MKLAVERGILISGVVEFHVGISPTATILVSEDGQINVVYETRAGFGKGDGGRGWGG